MKLCKTATAADIIVWAHNEYLLKEIVALEKHIDYFQNKVHGSKIDQPKIDQLVARRKELLIEMEKIR